MAGTMAKAGSRLWAPVRIPSFRLLWMGQSFSLLGDGFSYIAFSWITLSLTRSTLTLGYVLALQAVPRALLTLVGGSLSDKWSTRRLMTFSSWARAVVMGAVAAVGLSGRLNVPELFVAAAVFGAVDAFFQPARSSILPSVIEADLLAPANALLTVGARTSSVLGPAVGGMVVAVSNANYAFLVDGVCFALCGLCVSRVTTLPRKAPAPKPAPPDGAPAPAPAPAPKQDGMGARIMAGLRVAWSDPRIRTMLAVDTLVTFCNSGPFTVGFADLAKFRLDGGSTALGLLNGCLAGGALLGALAGGTVRGRPSVGLLVAALAGWLAAGMAVLGFVHNTPAAMATVLAMGFAIGFQGVFGLSWIQRNIQGEILSRVIAVDMVFGYAAAPVSLIVAGDLVRAHTQLLFGATAGLLVLTALMVLTSRPVREMR